MCVCVCGDYVVCLVAGVSWLQGDAMALPFPNNSFDAYTIVFGIRNVPNISQVTVCTLI